MCVLCQQWLVDIVSHFVAQNRPASAEQSIVSFSVLETVPERLPKISPYRQYLDWKYINLSNCLDVYESFALVHLNRFPANMLVH